MPVRIEGICREFEDARAQFLSGCPSHDGHRRNRDARVREADAKSSDADGDG